MLPPYTARDEDREASRQAVRRLVRRGALIVPAGSPFAQATVEFLDMLRHDGTVTGCEHVAARHDGDGLGHVVIVTWLPGLELRCGSCFYVTPPVVHCQICLRQPSPGLRTVIARRHTDGVVIVGRMCRDCRPGRVQ